MKRASALVVAITALVVSACDSLPLAAFKCTGPFAADCASKSPIPDEQDALMRWFWANYDTAADEEIHEALGKIHNLIDGGTLTQNIAGSLEDLSSEDLRTVEMTGSDPGLASGILLIDVMDCTVEHVERITTYSKQDELYPGVYDSYQRTYVTSLEDYLARSTHAVRWHIETTGTLLGSPYAMQYGGGDRLVPAREGSVAIGSVLLNRSWLRAPADFDDDTRAMDQDYQIEVWYERAPGTAVHLWGDWRQVRMGQLTNEDDVVFEVLLSNMQDWDAQTRTLCRENKPPPSQ